MTLWDQTYRISGDLAFKIKFLGKPDLFRAGNKDFSFFNRYVDVVECAAIIGFMQYNDKEKFETAMKSITTDEKSDSAEIPINTILKEQKKLKFLFRLIMLNENIRNLTLKEKTDNAFRNETNEILQEANEILFNSFVRLGVELLYEQIVEARDPEACLDLMETYISPGSGTLPIDLH